MTASAQVLNRFLSDGELYHTAGRGTPETASCNSTAVAHTASNDFDGPIAILVDQRTASGAEITAEILRRRRHAVLVGGHTFGRNSIQMLFPLEERNVFLKLTTSIIKFPDGGTIPHDGLIPDIPVYISSARQDEIIRAWRSYLQGKSRASGPTEFDPVLKAAIETLK